MEDREQQRRPGQPMVRAYRFGEFRLLVADRILERGGVRVQVTPKVLDTLLILLQNAGRVISKESLMQQVWPDVTVVPSGLTRNMSALRKAIGPEIETIPRIGYRFTGAVTVETFNCEVEPQKPVPWRQRLQHLFGALFLRPNPLTVRR